jgi:hypothetical protein
MKHRTLIRRINQYSMNQQMPRPRVTLAGSVIAYLTGLAAVFARPR